MTGVDPLAVLLKFGFLAVLYLFVLWIARSALRDLRRREEPVAADDGASEHDRPRRGRLGHDGAAADGEDPGDELRPRLEVVAAKGRDPGEAFDVDRETRLGRAEGAELRIEDSFASASHARIYPSGRGTVIEDLGSTNGTFVNGRQITRPLRLEVDDTVRIGDTELRYRE